MYVTMSHWEASEMTDEMIETMQTKFMPMVTHRLVFISDLIEKDRHPNTDACAT